VGLGGDVQGPRPYVDEPSRGAGQAWASGRVAERLTLTGIAAFDPSAFALGGAARIDLAKTRRIALGVEPELGFLWAALDVPFAIRLWDEAWIYTSPWFGTRGVDWSLDLPVGLSVHAIDGFIMRAEYAVSWSHDLVYAERRDRFAFGLAYQW
jgi:hypothetical protein